MLQAKSELDKDCWVREIREMLARQLADLKSKYIYNFQADK